MRLLKILFTCLFIQACLISNGQSDSANKKNTYSDSSSRIEARYSSNELAIPEMSSKERILISNPAEGLLVYDRDEEKFYIFSSGWKEINGATLNARIGADPKSEQSKQKNDIKKDDNQEGSIGNGAGDPSVRVSGDLEIEAYDSDANLFMKTNTGDMGKIISKEDETKDLLIGNLDGQGGKLVFKIDGMENMIIDLDGQVGIGTNDPNARLQVNSSTNEHPFRAQVNGSTKFFVHSNGGVSIGTTNTPPEEGLRIDGLRTGGTVPILADDSGNLIKDNRTHYIAINPMAFHPRNNGKLSVRETYLEVNNGTIAIAPLNIPHGAYVHKLVIRYDDQVALNVRCKLKKASFPGNVTSTIFDLQSSGSSGPGTRTGFLVAPYHQVDNENGNYYLEVTPLGGVPPQSVQLQSVHIEYRL